MIVACWAGTGYAKLYKWVDENGVAHYSNVAPPADQEVQTNEEAQGSAPVKSGSSGMDQLLDSYEREARRQEIEKPRNTRKNKPNKNEDLADYFKNRIEEEKEELRVRREELNDVERESYSDGRQHKKRVRNYKSRVKKAELELVRVKGEYKKAKYGK